MAKLTQSQIMGQTNVRNTLIGVSYAVSGVTWKFNHATARANQGAQNYAARSNANASYQAALYNQKQSYQERKQTLSKEIDLAAIEKENSILGMQMGELKTEQALAQLAAADFGVMGARARIIQAQAGMSSAASSILQADEGIKLAHIKVGQAMIEIEKGNIGIVGAQIKLEQQYSQLLGAESSIQGIDDIMRAMEEQAEIRSNLTEMQTDSESANMKAKYAAAGVIGGSRIASEINIQKTIELQQDLAASIEAEKMVKIESQKAAAQFEKEAMEFGMRYAQQGVEVATLDRDSSVLEKDSKTSQAAIALLERTKAGYGLDSAAAGVMGAEASLGAQQAQRNVANLEVQGTRYTQESLKNASAMSTIKQEMLDINMSFVNERLANPTRGIAKTKIANTQYAYDPVYQLAMTRSF